MATQRMFIAVIAGESIAAILSSIENWRIKPDADGIDRFCRRLREKADSLPIVHYLEWIDRWLFAQDVQGPGALEGRQFAVTCMTRPEAEEWSKQVNLQWQEQMWLSARLFEAATAWHDFADPALVLVVREILGPTTDDEDIKASMIGIPSWLNDCLPS